MSEQNLILIQTLITTQILIVIEILNINWIGVLIANIGRNLYFPRYMIFD